MTIYIDNDCKCHVEPAEGLRAVETDFFDGKCKRFIDGYRYVPESETWVREDGEVFSGEMIAPFEDYAILDAAQREYERQLLAEYEAVLTEIEKALEV